MLNSHLCNNCAGRSESRYRAARCLEIPRKSPSIPSAHGVSDVTYRIGYSFIGFCVCAFFCIDGYFTSSLVAHKMSTLVTYGPLMFTLQSAVQSNGHHFTVFSLIMTGFNFSVRWHFHSARRRHHDS